MGEMISSGSIEQDEQRPRLEDWKLIGSKLCAVVIDHPQIGDGAVVSLNDSDVTIPSHVGTPYTSATEAPDPLREGVGVQTSNSLYRLGQENIPGTAFY
jgi:hypothetical protein